MVQEVGGVVLMYSLMEGLMEEALGLTTMVVEVEETDWVVGRTVQEVGGVVLMYSLMEEALGLTTMVVGVEETVWVVGRTVQVVGGVVLMYSLMEGLMEEALWEHRMVMGTLVRLMNTWK